MPIPNINLIPPAYYQRIQSRRAALLASLLVLLEIIGLVAFAIVLGQRNTRLKADRDYWKQQADLVAAQEAEETRIRQEFAEVKTKMDFIQEVFQANATWPSIFDQIRDYTYPRARYAAMTPAPNTRNMTLRVRIPDTPELDAQRAMTLYWANLLRSPIVRTATVNQFLGYEGQAGRGVTDAGLPMPGGGPPMPGGGPPMPGGGPPVGPPMPGMMPGGGPSVGPPMPGGMPGGGPPVAPTGRWIGSPSQIASPALEAMAGAGANLAQVLGGAGETPMEALRQFGITVPTPPPLRDFDFNVELTETFPVPEFKAPQAAAAPEAGVPADDFTPTPID